MFQDAFRGVVDSSGVVLVRIVAVRDGVQRLYSGRQEHKAKKRKRDSSAV